MCIGQAHGFRLYVRKAGTSSWRRLCEDKDVYEFVLNSLPPATDYEFRVQAFNYTQGEGPSTNVVSASTAAGPPRSAPENLRASSVGLYDVLIEWSAPPASDGAVEGYLVYHDTEGEDTYQEIELGADCGCKFNSSFLMPDTSYRYQVCAFNSAGESPFTPVLTLQTKQDPKMRFLGTPRRESVSAPAHRQSYIRGSAHKGLAPEEGEGEEETEAAKKARAAKDAAARLASSSPKAVWKPRNANSKKTGLPSLSIPNPEAERERERKKQEQQERRARMGSMRARFEETVRDSELTEKLRRASVRAVPATAGQLSSGVGHVLPETEGERTRRREREERERFAAMLKQDGSSGAAASSHLQLNVPVSDLVDSTGTIRGRRNAVRAALAQAEVSARFESETLQCLWEEERDKTIVVYMTSLQAVRSTSLACDKILKLFRNAHKKVRVKDIHLHPDFASELRERYPAWGGADDVPQVFINFERVGDAEMVIRLNEQGTLGDIIHGFERADETCAACGGSGFVLCSWCQGSKKSVVNEFAEDPTRNALKCTVCNQNGLVRCEQC
eukprot:UC1_evm2s1012